MLKTKKELDYPTTIEYSKKDVILVQNELLKMAEITCNILEKNNIPYMLAYGTLLGAIRHQDFIPWDDDFDLFIFDDSYDLAIKILEKELPTHLLVHSIKNDPLYFKAWNSIKNLNTAVIKEDIYNQDNNLLRYNCISLDLYKLKKINSSDKEKYQLEEALKFFERKKDLDIIKDDFYHESIIKIKKKLSELKNTSDKLEKTADSYFFIINMNDTISIDDTLPLKKYKFSNTNFFGPNNPEAYLKSRYEDYTSIPEYNDRKRHYKKVVFIK